MKINAADNDNVMNYGKIISVRGSVVEVFFENNLPSIYCLLHTVKDKMVAVEVMTQLDNHWVRGISLNPTQGLSRGMLVETDDTQFTVPISKNIMGRMFDVFGNTIYKGEPLEMMEQRKIHHSPPPLS